jgi:hypothetical protein
MFLLYFAVLQCTSYQPISVADLGWIVNDVKPWYHSVYKISVFPRQPFTPWVRQWKRPFCACVLPKIIYTEIKKQFTYYNYLLTSWRRSHWPRGLRRRSVAACLLGLWVRIPPGAWMFVCCECCVLSGRSLCEELITRPEESYRLWCVVCDLETSWTRRPWPTGGCRAKNQPRNKRPGGYLPGSFSDLKQVLWRETSGTHT